MPACRDCGRAPTGPANPLAVGGGRGEYDQAHPEWDTTSEGKLALRRTSRTVYWPEKDLCPDCWEPDA